MKKIYILFCICITFIFPTTVLAANTELLKDTQFRNGFGACFWLGAHFNPGPEWLKKGLCSSYISTPGYSVKVIPDNDQNKSVSQNNENKYWEINDGIHDRDANNTPIVDPFFHRFNVNNRIIDNLPSVLNVEQLNHGGQRVKQIASDKQGKIYLYYNSKNENRNVANKYNASFAYDTWPTFQLNQNFREHIDLAHYDQINVSLQPKIISWSILPNWPYEGISGYSQPEMSLNLYTFIRNRNQLNQGIFVGMALYSSEQSMYQPYSDVDQLGQGFFRDTVNLYGGPAKPNEYTTIQFDLLKLIDKALTGTGKTHTDYVLSSFDIGYEGMGWFEGAFDVRNLSMTGVGGPASTSSPASTVTPIAGDHNNDGHVNLADYTIIISKFAAKYTIFDYNNLVTNYGK